MNYRRLQPSWVITLLALSGCHHHVSRAVAPLAPRSVISVPPPTHHSEPLPLLETESSPPLAARLTYRSLPRFHPRATTARQLALLLRPAPPLIVLGDLTTGGEASDTQLRQETASLIHTQQERLRTLPRSYFAQHHEEVEQARLFLRQALEALHRLDLEGARILATKAKVLLDEL